MQNINKKGISNVVATVLIILVSVIAISAVYVSLKPALTASLSPAISCLDLKLNSLLEVQSACFNNNTKKIEISIGSMTNLNGVNSIDFGLDENGYTVYNWICGGSCSSCQFEGNKYYLPIEGFSLNLTENQTIYLQVSNCLRLNKKVVEC
ncbi:MAG: hypothetical protein AABX66_04125 [Nanoarchaeota archaeon]